jgi:hypothetical protein
MATVGSPAGRHAAAELEALGESSRFDAAEQTFTILGERLRQLDDALVEAQLAARGKGSAGPGRRRSRRRTS